MLTKIIAIALLIIGVFIALVLFTYGGPILPHIIGPGVLVLAGTSLLWFTRTKPQKPNVTG